MGTTIQNKEVVTRNRMGFSNVITALLNFVALLCSIACIGMGIWLATRHGSACLRDLQWPIIAVGLFLFVFSILGILGAILRIKILLYLYLAVALLIIIALLCIAAFAFIVTSRGSGQPVNGKAYDDYYLHDYSRWMRQELRSQSHWTKIKKCIQDLKVCQELKDSDQNSFYNDKLSPLESGCCKPLTACNFTFVNATYWIPPKDANSDSYADCSTWNNDPSKLCYDCDSCRAGVAENTRRAWSKMALACAVLLVFLIVVYSLGCCAVRNNKNRYYEKRKVQMTSPYNERPGESPYMYRNI